MNKDKNKMLNKKSLTGIRRDIKKYKALFLMVAVPLLILFIFQYVPLYGLQIAFRNYTPLGSIWDSEWVGLKYFKQFFSHYKFNELLENTVLLNLYDVLLTPIPLLFAMCMQKDSMTKLRLVSGTGRELSLTAMSTAVLQLNGSVDREHV